MFGLQLFLKRKRRMLIRYGAVALVGVTVIAIALPRADAHDTNRKAVASDDPIGIFFSPERVASGQFAVFYNLPHS